MKSETGSALTAADADADGFLAGIAGLGALPSQAWTRVLAAAAEGAEFFWR
jgi:hypothetical protein